MKQINENEPELLTRLSNGDSHAFTQMYEQYNGRIKWFASAITKGYIYDLEDLSQDVFMTIWEKKSLLPMVTNVDGYLFVTVRNILINNTRQKQVREKVYNEYKYGQQVWYNDTESNALQKFLKEISIKAIATLSDQRREVFRLHIYCGLSQKEVAEKLSISTQRVGQHLAQAKIQVREYLEKNADWIVVGSILIIMMMEAGMI